MVRCLPRRFRLHKAVLLLLYLTTIILGSRILFQYFADPPHSHAENSNLPEENTDAHHHSHKNVIEAADIESGANHLLTPVRTPNPLPEPIHSVPNTSVTKGPVAGASKLSREEHSVAPAGGPKNINLNANAYDYPTKTDPGPELGTNHWDKSIKETYPKVVNGKLIIPRRVVHLDLKGAPPKVEYLLELFPFIQKLGGTSILLEWEDMFPYKEQLAAARHKTAYTEQEVSKILTAANASSLEIIPLVQTFGHLEWILKLDRFRHLREDSRYPQVMCVGEEEAWTLIKEAMDQVAELHKPFGIPFFHIGADEVFQAGTCPKDRALVQTHKSKQRFILWHISRTAEYLREKHGTRVLAWHDMFVNAALPDLRHYKMIRLVEPVIWNYAEDLNYYLPRTIWNKLKPFPYIWGASAFKGADGPARFYANPQHYVRNHESWIRQINSNYAGFRQFRGLIMTGWSRYDHLSLICEVLPVAMPSLALNLNLISTGSASYESLDKLVNCQIRPTSEPKRCTFPGARIYELVQDLKRAQSDLHNGIYQEHEFQGWLSRTAVRYNVSSRWYLDKLAPRILSHYSKFSHLRSELKNQMDKVFQSDTSTEFLYQYLDEDLEKLRSLKEAASTINNRENFPLRPFVEDFSSADTPKKTV